MKASTTKIIEQLFTVAEERMYQEGWSPDEIFAFKTDPVISLFYGACAEEIGSVYQEINRVEQGLINKTIQQFLPEEFHSPTPSHAVFQAQPLDKLPECTIGSEYQLSVFKQEPLKTQLVFTPAGRYTLYPADIEYLVFRNNLYQYEDGKKVLRLTASTPQSTQDDFFWIGINGLNAILPRKEISIFFSLPKNVNENYSFLNTLKFCKCSDGIRAFRMETGLPANDTDIREKILQHPDYMIYRILDNAKNWYQNNFITLYDLPKLNPENPYFPIELSKLFSTSELEKIKGDIYWIKFKSGNLLKESWMSQLFCSLNCFPAVNLKIEQEQFDVETMPLNIFPISCSDHILSIKSISGKSRTKVDETDYQIIDANYKETVGLEGQAIFRKGGLRRLDPEKLKAMLNQLSNLLKEETILLTKDGTKDDLDKLNRLNRALNDFEQSIESGIKAKSKFSGSVILKPFRDQIKIFIRYWSTAGDTADQIKPLDAEERSKQCEIVYGPDLKADTVKLITITTGGKKQPTEEEHIDTLRKLLLTRGRIVTAEDIKAFCYEHFSGHNISVEVKKSYIHSQNSGQGITRVVDVQIRLFEKNKLSSEELILLKEELRQKLEQNSANILPFRVEII